MWSQLRIIISLVLCVFSTFIFLFAFSSVALCADEQPPRTLVLAHYMPWYESQPQSPRYGWHWTMNHFDPTEISGTRRQAASHYYPLIGCYDSNDKDVLEYHVLLMKLAGIDGVIIDWYGKDNYLDYALNHRNTQAMIDCVTRLGLRFAIIYEDQTVPKLIKGGVIAKADAIQHAHELLLFVAQNWFKQPNYVRVEQRPLFLVFGPQYFQDDDWKTIFADIEPQPMYFTLQRPRGPAVGGFSWPLPAGAAAESEAKLQAFYQRAKDWRFSIPAAYPRFHDIYADAGVHDSWGRIEDRDGETYRHTLRMALDAHPKVVQLVTWNDWGEGTQIEPSVEFGYRDLELTQKFVHQFVNPEFKRSPEDLRLPLRLFELRKASAAKNANANAARLNKIAQLISVGDLHSAAQLIHDEELQR